MNEQEIGGLVKRSFFEENLATSEQTSLKYGSPSPRGTGTYNSPDVHQHVSQMSVGAGLTDCSEAEEDEDTFEVEQPTDDEDIRQARIWAPQKTSYHLYKYPANVREAHN